MKSRSEKRKFPSPTRKDDCSFIGGVPLGGIGTGTVEVRADGSLRSWQIFNNWGDSQTLGTWKHFPSYDLLNSFLAVNVNNKAYILETKPVAGLPGVKGIEYDGKFPFVNLTYYLPDETPVELSLEAFSGFIPHHLENSGIPAFSLGFGIKNVSDKPLDISFALSVVNPFGTDCKINNIDGYSIAECTDGRSGLAIASLDAKAKYVLGGTDTELVLRKFWSAFTEREELQGQFTGRGQRIALVVSLKLEPGVTEHPHFVVGWFFPDHEENGDGPFLGHRYEEWISSAVDSVRLFARKYTQLYDESAAWRDTMLNSSWPAWVTDWLINTPSNIIKSSWWVRDGRFMMYESFNCPSSNHLLLIDIGTWPVLDLFPELELSILRQYAEFQHDNGQLPEAMGDSDHPSVSSAGGRNLMDLSPKYAVEVWHRYKETGDKTFLDDTYAAVKKAILYARGFDQNSDGLPDHVGMQSAWDLYDIGYVPSYTASVWLTGLRATEKLAMIKEDDEFVFDVHRQIEKGKTEMESKLWNGEYYALNVDKNDKQNPTCMSSQVYGEMLGVILGLGTVLPIRHVKSALKAIAKYNSQSTRYGIVISATRDGRIVIPTDTRVQILTCRVIPTLLSMVALGSVEEGLELLKELYDIFDLVQPGGIWNQADCVTADGRYHPRAFTHYIMNQNIWALMKTLNGWNYNATDQTLTVGPVLTPEDCYGPWMVPTAYGILRQKVANGSQRVRLEVRRGNMKLRQMSVKLRIPRVAEVSIRLGQELMPCRIKHKKDAIQINFQELIMLTAGDKLDVNLATK